MNNQQNPTQIEEKRLCKKCGQRLPSKSGFCMYCGTDNSITSVQHELEKQNNEQLKKYKVIESQKHKPLWYLIFLLLLIDIIVISTIMIFNTNNMYVKVNTARFQDYEEAFYIADDVYLGLKNQKAKVIGANRQDYIEISNTLKDYNIRDAKLVDESYTDRIYILTEEKKLFTISGKIVKEIELEEEYNDIYDYLNKKKNNCVSEKEYAILDEGVYYYNSDENAIFFATNKNFKYEANKSCYSYDKERVIKSEELKLNNPTLIYQDYRGDTIILKDKNEIVKIEYGLITERIKEFKVNGKKIPVEKIKKIFYGLDYLPTDSFTIIDNKDGIYNTTSSENNYTNTIKNEIDLNVVSTLFKALDKETKINLLLIVAILIVNLIIIYKMSDKHTFSKCITIAGIITVELILFVIIRGDGIKLDSVDTFFQLIETLILLYLLLTIVAMLIIQIAELVIKLLDLIKFRNIFSFILTFAAITSIFLVISLSGKYGLFFSVFALGAFWAYYTESEDIDIDLFIMPKTRIPIAVLSIVNVILFFLLLNIFHICNYFVFLFLISVMFALYLTVRPTLTKKELTGKTTKSLLILIMYIAYTFISGLFAMNLFTSLQKDYQGILIKYVLMTAATNVLYLVVTFVLLIIISTVFRLLHKIIKISNKKTNSIVIFLIFSIVTLITFTAAIYFFPEIMSLIDTVVQNISSNLYKN